MPGQSGILRGYHSRIAKIRCIFDVCKQEGLVSTNGYDSKRWNYPEDFRYSEERRIPAGS